MQQAKQLVMQLMNSRLELDVVTCDVSLRVSDDGPLAVMLLADLRNCILELVGDNKRSENSRVVGTYQFP